MYHILIIEDKRVPTDFLRHFLSQQGHRVSLATTGAEGVRLAEEIQPDIILLDTKLPDGHGIELLPILQESVPGVHIMVMTAYGSVSESVQAMKLGAKDYLLKPIDVEHLGALIEKLPREQRRPERGEDKHDRMIDECIIGQSPCMKRLFQLIARAARAEEMGICPTILIQGETGTGKELVARAIHRQGPRARFPFVEINCPAIPDSLLEAELFGYERGAFTDARSDKKGLFEVADCGILFLDEIGDLKLDMQVKLLKVIEEKVIRRLGSTQERPVDIQVLVATNRPLEEAVRQGTFREDLFFRLSVITLTLPPLRDRREDILLLARYFLDQYTRPRHLPPITISQAAQEKLLTYPWPGNVRELRHVIERALLLEKPTRLEPHHLHFPASFCSLPSPRFPVQFSTNNSHGFDIELPDEGIVLDELEKMLIQKALLRSTGNQTKAARLLGLTRNTLRYRMEKYGIV